MRLTTVGLLAMVALGCGDSSGPAPVDVEGAWAGAVSFSDGSPGTLSFTVTETSGSVTGSGTLVGGNESAPLSISGSYSEPNVSMTMTSSGFQPVNLSATVSSSAMSGTLNGSGFLNSAFTLQRQ